MKCQHCGDPIYKFQKAVTISKKRYHQGCSQILKERKKKRKMKKLGRAMLEIADGETSYLGYVGDLPHGDVVVKIMSKFLNPMRHKVGCQQRTPAYKDPPIFYVAYTQRAGHKQMFESDVCYSRVMFGKQVRRIFWEWKVKRDSRVVLSA